MNRDRSLLLVVALLVVVGVVTGTSGISSMGADRDIRVAIADDDSAYVGFNQTASGTTTGTTNLDLTLTNQFPSGVTLQGVTVTVDGETANLGPLEPGESNTTEFDGVDCDSSIVVEASGDSVEVQLDREVDCSS